MLNIDDTVRTGTIQRAECPCLLTCAASGARRPDPHWSRFVDQVQVRVEDSYWVAPLALLSSERRFQAFV